MKAPLGPTTRKGACYFDEMGHEYTSVEHLLRCAIARALGVERSTRMLWRVNRLGSQLIYATVTLN